MTSTTNNSQPRILVVGAGPSGLIAALTLAKNDVPVRIIEKSTTYRIGQRGAGTMPRTFEVYEALGVIDEAMKNSIPVPMMRMYKHGSGTEIEREVDRAPYTPPTPDRPYLSGRLLGQDKLDQILRPHLERYGISVELGVELVSFEEAGDHVKVKLRKESGEEEEASYDYLVGADGAKGVVRKGLGLSFVGETREQKMLVGEFDLEGLSEERWHVFGDVSDYVLNLRPTETPGRFTFTTGGKKLPNPSELLESDETLLKYIKDRTGGRDDIKITNIVWAGPYTVNIRMVETYQKGRVLITGGKSSFHPHKLPYHGLTLLVSFSTDAAHIHSPTGGQGMNTGIQDSYNLAWKLALVSKQLSPPSLLESITPERIPVVAEMLNLTTQLLEARLLGRDAAPESYERKGSVMQLGVNYRTSPIVLDDTPGAKAEAKSVSAYGGPQGGPVCAGDRAPDAPGLVAIHPPTSVVLRSGDPKRLFKILDPTRHTVLVFGDKPGAMAHASIRVVRKYPKELVRFVLIGTKGSKERTARAAEELYGAVDVYEDGEGHAYEAYKGPKGTSNVFIIRPDGYVGARLAGVHRVDAYFQGIFSREAESSEGWLANVLNRLRLPGSR